MNLMKMIDSSQPPVTHIYATLSGLFYTFHRKMTQRIAYEKMPEERIKLYSQWQSSQLQTA
jgi:hypothetical protein